MWLWIWLRQAKRSRNSYEAEAKRRKQSVLAGDAAKSDEAGKRVQKHIEPERLYKAIRYLKEHPEQQSRRF
jgi:hypothetical protein